MGWTCWRICWKLEWDCLPIFTNCFWFLFSVVVASIALWLQQSQFCEWGDNDKTSRFFLGSFLFCFVASVRPWLAGGCPSPPSVLRPFARPSVCFLRLSVFPCLCLCLSLVACLPAGLRLPFRPSALPSVLRSFVRPPHPLRETASCRIKLVSMSHDMNERPSSERQLLMWLSL